MRALDPLIFRGIIIPQPQQRSCHSLGFVTKAGPSEFFVSSLAASSAAQTCEVIAAVEIVNAKGAILSFCKLLGVEISPKYCPNVDRPQPTLTQIQQDSINI